MSTLGRAALAFVLLLLAQAPAAAVERILTFISDAVVQRSGDVEVTETITVVSEGTAIRRGIFRDFPTRYQRRDGSRVEVDFEVSSVTRNGQPESWTYETLSNGARIRIGSADRLIDPGRHEYVIRYRTNRQIGFFPNYDELYWNATGNGWQFSIEQAEARITLPEAVPFIQTAFYTGPQGAQGGRDAAIVEQQPGRIVFRTTRALPPKAGLTVAVAWQKGLVEPPSAAAQAGWLLRDNSALLAAVIGLALVLAYYLFAWNKVGRDPPTGTIIPLFKPPEGLSAAAVRYVDQMGFDNRCFTAAIVELGVNGRLRLVEDGPTTTAERRDGGKAVGAAEQAMERALFAGSASLRLTQAHHERIGKGRDALRGVLEGAYKNRLFTNNFGWSGFGVLLALAAVAAVVFAVAKTYGSDNAPGAIMGMLIPVIPVIAGAGMIAAGWSRYSGGKGLMIVGALVAFAGLAFGFVVIWASVRGWVELLPGIAPTALGLLSAFAFAWLQAPTREGRRVMDEIDGLREYLGVAEEDRLQALHPPDKTPELFERFLPYAIALDVENAWGRRFASVLAAAAAGAAAGAVASTWYSGSHDWSNDPVSFADHLGSELSSTIASAATAPGSSDSGGGSSGGGSSGGGGGGGGGGGW